MTARSMIPGLLLLAMSAGMMAAHPAVAQGYAQPIVRVPDAAATDRPDDTPPAAADAAETGERISCVSVDAIRQAEIKSDRVVELRLRGGAIYEMRLAGRCHGLAFYDGFYYRTTPSRQLCAGIDVIMARSGSRCPIDAFVLVGKAKVKKGKADKAEKAERSPR